MNLNKLFVLSRSANLGRNLFAVRVAQKGDCLHRFQSRRFIRSSARSLAYAKDLFLGKVNKVLSTNCRIMYCIIVCTYLTYILNTTPLEQRSSRCVINIGDDNVHNNCYYSGWVNIIDKTAMLY